MSPTTGLCEGCLRTLDEIAAWSRMEDEEKRVVWARLEERRGTTGVAEAKGPTA